MGGHVRAELPIDCRQTVRSMLAVELEIAPTILTDDFRWCDAIGYEDAELFLDKLDAKFSHIERGLSFGEGLRLFPDPLGEESLGRIETLGRLIAHVERHCERVAAIKRDNKSESGR